jgi:hypothetical protein
MDARRERDETEGTDELEALKRLLGGPAPNAATDAAPAGAPAVRFELEGRAQPHALGEVGFARDGARAGRRVRLLWLRAPAATDAELEARIEELGRRLAALSPAGFVPVQTLGRTQDGGLELAGEAPEGESVRALLERRGTLAPRHALEIARQVLLLLELAHADGLAHGALDAGSVWLASRSPWDERNPFGVRVRLLDTGLAPILAPSHDMAARDLTAVGTLLAETLTGTGGELGAADWPALRAALPAREIGALPAREIGALLARVLGDGVPFASAAEFRAALERTASWRGERRGARLELALAGVVVLLALLGLWSRERGARAAERARAAAELAAARDESWHPAAAAALDRFLERLEEGEPARAAEGLAAARARPELAGLGFEAGWLEALLAARAALDQGGSEAGSVPGTLARESALLAARTALAQARAAREPFLLAAARWLPLPPRPGRAADCARWQASLERELAQRTAALAAGGLVPGEPGGR